ncbi:ion channel protein Tsx [Thalassotalea marina]|uniref:Ion channel protein Tsx n=1 Tax=Thalassotalea marina TaxID=1673741 RepID=A0A919BDS8_9GAMM|nr:ion channel protein Tsx [Thalassotalea marina]
MSLLGSNQYEIGDNNRTLATFELASGHSWGDSFLFVDRAHFANGDKTTYTEWSPRIKITEQSLSKFNNLYLASTVEAGDNFTHYLLGLGTDIKIPGFKFFKANFYYRNNDKKDNGSQVTLAWAYPLNDWLYDGFIDYVPATDDAATSMNFTSQLKYNLGPAFGLSTRLYIGIEYVHWNNKYGISQVDERNINWLIKYHF